MKKKNQYSITARVAFIVILAFAASSVYAQVPKYGCALLYSEPNATSVPPIYAGQPAAVTTAYLWLDDLMRLDNEGQILAYIRSMSVWNDTMQNLASYLYQIQDDNPLTYYNWDDAGIYPHPYKGDPSQSAFAFINQAVQLGGILPNALLNSEIISDITVSDTICEKDVSTNGTMDQVLVNCVINDEIKGKFVPGCPSLLRSRKKGALPQSDTTSATPLYADTASTGTCLQFDYSPEWGNDPTNDMSQRIGWWIKPGQEYIVFLGFLGITSSPGIGYFMTGPVVFGHEAGMYPVIGGIVQDPFDDFHLGGTGLTVAEWKSRFRAKIYSFTHP